MPRDGTIKRTLTGMVIAGAVTPLVVGAFAAASMVVAGGEAVGVVAVAVIAVALSISFLAAGLQRVGALHGRFERATKLANEVATVRLPQALEAARDGRAVTGELTPLVPDHRDELGDLIVALDRTQRTAITLASEQARVRRQASEMFIDLGRRHQALLGRTLSLVSELESSERDPSTVTDLLRLDHLVTRMRRNAESLLVLAGSEPGRVRTEPCTIDDVIRNALGEIEAFDRIDEGVVEVDRVVGRAVGAVAHLIAELLENATVFSPPDSSVVVNGVHRPDGYIISIIDVGIGLKPEELDDANQRLTQFRSEFTPPRRLGLAVVAELARRHGIVVQLQPTHGGGTTASVLLSPALLAGPADGIASPRVSAVSALDAPPPSPTVAPSAPAAAPLAEAVAAVVPAANGQDAAPPDASDQDGDSDRLPRRAPGEHLPDLGPRRDESEVPVRDEVDVAAQLSGFQDGVERARAQGDGVEADGSDALETDDDPDHSDGALDGVAAAVLTEGGLERRVAGSNLPDTGPPRDPSATTPPRDPEDVRSALTSFQYGVARGTLEPADPLNGEEPS